MCTKCDGSGEIIQRKSLPCCGSAAQGRENLCPCLYHDGEWPIEAITPCTECRNGRIVAERQNGKTYRYPNAPKQLRALPERVMESAERDGRPLSDEMAQAVARSLQRTHDLRDYFGYAADVRLPPDFLI